ncbi:MAG: anti-sigma factor family protein [Massilia sp.]
MSISDEVLMAYADGELDEPTRLVVEQAMKMDQSVADRVRRHKLLRTNVFNAFAGTMDEAVPQRLQAAARSGKVVHLDNVRQLRTPPPVPPAARLAKRRWSWPEWGALAATLVLGVLGGTMGAKSLGGEEQLAGFDNRAGTLTAQGKLAQALSTQLASNAGADANVKVGVSFVSKEGSYCRSFMLPSTAGLACNTGGAWRIPVMTNGPMGASSEYRQAGSALPAAVLEAIDERIVGRALDADAERAAQKQGWKR